MPSKLKHLLYALPYPVTSLLKLYKPIKIVIIFPFTAGGPPLPLHPARQVPARSSVRASRASLEDPHLHYHPGAVSGHSVGRQDNQGHLHRLPHDGKIEAPVYILEL